MHKLRAHIASFHTCLPSLASLPFLPGSQGLLTSYYLWSFPPITKLRGGHVTRGGVERGWERTLAILHPHLLLDLGNLFYLLKLHKK